MYAQLPDGIYDFDETPTNIINTQRSQDLNGAQIMFNSKLYFKNKYSLIEYDGANLNSRGYDLRDSLPSDKWGEITALTSSFKFIYAAVKGLSYSHLLTFDENRTWQYYAKIPTMGLWVRKLMLSSTPDSIDRLWVLFGNHGYPGYFLNPVTNPLVAGTYSYVPTGHFTPPKYDGGLSEISGGFYSLNVSGDSIDASNKITCFYGINANEPVTSLGIVVSTSQTILFGSPNGIDAYKIAPKFMLTGSGGSPVFRKAIINYLKDPDKRETFEFTIDLDKTSQRETRPMECVIGSLTYEANVKTLLPFWYGFTGTRHVKLINNPFSEKVDNQQIYESERGGKAQIKLAELI
jgi:hypothetical protein